MFPALKIVAVSFYLLVSATGDQTGTQPIDLRRNTCFNTIEADGTVLEQWSYDSDTLDMVRIMKNGKVVKEYGYPEYFHLTIYTKGWQESLINWGGLTPDEEVPFDFDGDGHDDVIIGYWTGGAHCCFGAIVFSTFGRPKELGKVDFKDGDLNRLCDLDKDGRPEFWMADWTFRYWHASFADSPSQRVVVGFRNGQFVAIPKLMKRPAPSVDEWKGKVDEWKGKLESRNSADARVAWAPMLKLIYSGQGEYAWKLLDSIWPDEKPAPQDLADWQTKAAFKTDFLIQLKESPYWNEVKTMNGW